jgi:hypothetical protein
MKSLRLLPLVFAAALAFAFGAASIGHESTAVSQEMAGRESMQGSANPQWTVQGAVLGAQSKRRATTVTAGFVPKHEQWAASNGWRKVDSPIMVGAEPGAVEYEWGQAPGEGNWTENHDEPGIWNGMSLGYDECSPDFCEAAFRNWQFLGGVHGFTGPANRGEQGSFGIYEAINHGAMLPLGIPTEVGWQVGARLTQSNLSGTTFSLESRHQIFLTTGLFHRVDRGLQWGLVVDWLHEDWYFEADLMQLRGEISWRAECDHEVGLAFASGTGTATAASEFRPIPGNQGGIVDESWQTTDWYVGFYRLRFGDCEANTLRAFAGFTSQSDGLLGAESVMQINERWAVQSGFTFLVPAEAPGMGLDAGHAQESWNVSVGLIWTPGCSTAERGYYAPLMNVADNGTFLVDRK